MKTVEFNAKFERSDDTLGFAKTVVMITPPLNADYWLFRVPLHKDQSIVGFPKFGTIGIGFAIEEKDWNTNLPFNFSPEKIYDHINVNKKYEEITKADCIEAIAVIIERCKEYVTK